MSEVLRLLLTVAMSGFVLTAFCGVVIWYMDEERSIRRSLKRVLGATPESVVIAKGRGRGAGFSFATGKAGVAWDSGAWCLVYRIDELMGAELVVDGIVVARAFRGEPRRALEARSTDAGEVTLRLIFDDPQDPDFDLDLWLAGDDERRRDASPTKAVQEANRWMARAEAIFRRPFAPRPEPVAAARDPLPLEVPPTPVTPTFSREANAAPAPAARAMPTPPWEEIVEEPIQDAIVEEIDDDEDDGRNWDEIPRRI